MKGTNRVYDELAGRGPINLDNEDDHRRVMDDRLRLGGTGAQADVLTEKATGKGWRGAVVRLLASLLREAREVADSTDAIYDRMKDGTHQVVIGDLGPGVRLRALGADATRFGETKNSFRDRIFDTHFKEWSDDGLTPADMEDLFGRAVSITALGSGASPGAASFVNGYLDLATGTDTDGGVVLDIGPVPYNSAAEAEAYWTQRIIQSLGANVEVFSGFGSGTFGAAGSDAQGVLIQGNASGAKPAIQAYYRNGLTNNEYTKSGDDLNGDTDAMKRTDGTTYELNPYGRMLLHGAYAYLGHIPGETEFHAPNDEWHRLHKWEAAVLDDEERNFAEANQYLRFVIRKTGGSDSTNYHVRFASAALFRTGTPMEAGTLRAVLADRTADTEGAIGATAYVENASADATLTVEDDDGNSQSGVPTGYDFYAVSYSISALNTAGASAGRLYVRHGSGGKPFAHARVDQANVGSAGRSVNGASSDPGNATKFTGNPYLDVVAGTLAVDVTIRGYLRKQGIV